MNGQPDTKTIEAADLLKQGMAAAATGDTVTATDLFTRAFQKDPTNATTCNELGVIHYRSDNIDQAKAWFQKAVALKPDFVRALTNLGACFNEHKDNASAVKCYKKALSVQPRMVDAWGNLAKAWTEAEEFELAIYAYYQAIDLDPKGEFYRGLAKAYRKSGRYDRSEQALKIAIDKNPDDHDAHFGLAYTYFHLENYAAGVREFEWRWKTKDMVKHASDLHPIFNRPAYDGTQNLSDKTLLLHTEQGFGDNLQFARFIDLVRPRVKRLVMWTRPGLGRLFKQSFDIDQISENVFQLPEFDYQLPLMSIPFYFDQNLDLLEQFKPYLSAPPSDTAHVKADPSRLNVGLVWGASDSGFDYANKKVPLHRLNELLKTPGVEWYSLQVGSDLKDLTEQADLPAIKNIGSSLANFADTARAIKKLDLVISVDTSVAHLAGAMGKPVWVMLKKNPDWRWHADGESTVWYPSARLFRQDSHGDWSSVIRRIQKNLNLTCRS